MSDPMKLQLCAVIDFDTIFLLFDAKFDHCMKFYFMGSGIFLT